VLAWEQVLANRAAPGIDGVTLARWGRNWQANLERLSHQVRTNTYRPNRPRRFVVFKKGGGQRELSCLTVTDKVLQRAVLNVIEAPFERRFLDCSHGYRPRRSVATAVQQVLSHRDRGLRWVLDADIRACFDSLDHTVLIGLIRRVIDDWFVLNLTEMWLKAGRKHRHQALGVPMGGVLSPLWCNIYLHQLDAHLTTQRWALVRYADDFIVLSASPEEAQRAWQEVANVLEKLKLQLSPHKTRLTSFEEGFEFLGVAFQGERYAYTWRDKRIEVAGRKLGWLYRCPPDFY
jgi:group II intron reverse transcriptase/maturase